MSETVLAALIAAGATIFTSLMQLKSSIRKELAARAQTARRKNRMPSVLLAVMLSAAAVCGFALSQWFTERERITQHELRQELQARIAELSRTASQLKQTRLDERAEIETDVLRRLGGQGATAIAMVAPCKPMPVLGAATLVASAATENAPAAPVCTESEATEVTLCAAIPTNAVVSEIDLFTRFTDADTPWSESLVNAGEEVGEARFSEKPTRSIGDDGTQHVCHRFANWSTRRERIARMIVRYALTDSVSSTQAQVRRNPLPAATGALVVR